jgi:hypothetical protein
LDLYDVEAAERVEAELDNFITKRAREKAEANRVEEEWLVSERSVREQHRQSNRMAWIDYFGHMHRLHLGLAAEHADRMSRLLAECEYETDEAPDPDDVGEGGLLE